MQIATPITNQAGITLLGKPTKSPAMMMANTAFTIRSSKKMTIMKSARALSPTTDSVRAPMDLPSLRTLAHRAPASWIPAKNTVPRVTHRNAGSQPHITAMAGPTMGAAPATEVKWCPHSTHRLVGTKSTPSSRA